MPADGIDPGAAPVSVGAVAPAEVTPRSAEAGTAYVPETTLYPGTTEPRALTKKEIVDRFRTLFLNHSPRLYDLARQKYGDRYASKGLSTDDLVQESFLRLLEHMIAADGNEPDNVDKYIATIMDHCFHDRYRKDSRRGPEWQSRLQTSSPLARQESDIRGTGVHGTNFIDALDPQISKILLRGKEEMTRKEWEYYEQKVRGHSVSKIAKTLKKSMGTVSEAIRNAEEKIDIILKKEFPDLRDVFFVFLEVATYDQQLRDRINILLSRLKGTKEE